MALYEELKQAYTTQVIENKSFISDNFSISKQIASALQHYLDLPSDTGKKSGAGHHLIYLRVDSAKGYIPSEDLESAVMHYPEGKFLFGLGLLLQADDQSKTKQFVNFAFSCDRTGDHLIINVLDSSFEMVFSASKPLDLALMCQHIFDDLIGGLNWRISDEIEKTRVGFDITPVDDQTG